MKAGCLVVNSLILHFCVKVLSPTLTFFFNHYPKIAKSFVNGLLTVDPSRRMTATEALNHPWLTESLQQQEARLQQQQQMMHEQQQHQNQDQDMEGAAPHDLLPSMMTHIKASTRKFRKAALAVQAMNALRKRHEDLREVHTEEVSHVLHRGDEDMV